MKKLKTANIWKQVVPVLMLDRATHVYLIALAICTIIIIAKCQDYRILHKSKLKKKSFFQTKMKYE